jgi:hypothetical protein
VRSPAAVAAPAGGDAGTRASGSPCAFKHAAEVAGMDDEIVVLSGQRAALMWARDASNGGIEGGRER